MSDADLGEAYAERLSGNPRATVEICRRIIASEPMHYEARSLLAVCFVEAGQLEQARPLIEEAVAADPENWRLLLNLSVLREAEGLLDEALAQARDAAARAPERFEAWGRLGDLYGRQGDFASAASALERAFELRPEHAGLALLLAAAAYETAQYQLAADALDRFEGLGQANAQALRLRTHLARKRGDTDASVEAARSWLVAEPRSEEARVALAHGLAQREDFHAAVEIYRPLAITVRATADHAATFARYLLWSRDFDGAELQFNRALEIDPGHAEAAAGLARLNVYRGHFAQAATFARRALDADAANVEAFAQLALASEMKITDEDLSRLQDVAENPATDSDQRASAWFTLGSLRHARREPDHAFDAWLQANEIKQQAARSTQWRYDPVETEQLIDRLIEVFAKDAPSSPPVPPSSPTPIFIVGMPRSGTTLLDSALAAHPAVSSGGELPAMPSLLTRFLQWIDETGWAGGALRSGVAAEMRTAYLRQYSQYGIAPARLVTDKQPLNILSVGLIRHLFPQAPIIHIKRDAVETGFSIFRNNFTRSWRFANSLANIGHFFGQYARLMEHWSGILGDRMAEIQYEQLVADFEGELQRAIAFIGLDWDPAVLSYFEQDGVVTTLSAAQVRKPPSPALGRSSSAYRSRLRPLVDALEQAGVSI